TIGAPKTQLADSTLDRLRQQFPHVKIESAEFTPRSIPGKSLRPDQEGNLSHGVKLSVKDYDQFRPVRFGVKLFEAIIKATEGATITDYIYKLAGSDAIDSYNINWQEEIEAYKKARQPYLLYD